MTAARTDTFTIDRTLPGERLDKFLSGRYPAVSRGAMQRLIDQGHIQVNARPARPTQTPRAGDV
ncbi:MAG TPA: S4 domain-containing protein, partial [Verrucomicrobiae bacterium]|nr:S4 domain-containing protein [Verrucomicrobiae bacterium]